MFTIPLNSLELRLDLPGHVAVLEPARLPPLTSVSEAIAGALAEPIGTLPFTDLVRAKLASNPNMPVVIVVSDNTRPVPYTGPSGILWPLLEYLLQGGINPDRITVLVASGTHRQLSEHELRSLLDPRVTASGAVVRCHDAFDPRGLVTVGRTSEGLEVKMDRGYVQAGLRILTGLVESHLMAGASGGRKSVCPGLVGVDSVRDFHGAAVLDHPSATDLVTSGNPCHALSLEIARLAPADFILNVTAHDDGAVTGVFAGDMERAHEAAVEHLRRSMSIPLDRKYDIVITHGGRVGVNHYQAAKAAAVAVRAVKTGGQVILVADTVDPDPIGSMHYRALMTLLKDIGHEAFGRLILSPDWPFVPDQWQVQMWRRVFQKIPPDHLHYYSPQTPLFEYGRLPGRSPQWIWEQLAPLPEEQRAAAFVRETLSAALREARNALVAGGGAADDAALQPQVAFLPTGPYGIPVESQHGIEG